MPDDAPTLRVYDIATDQFRPATQADLDQFQDIVQSYGLLIRSIEIMISDYHDLCKKHDFKSRF